MDLSRDILQFLHYHPLSSRDEIARGITIRFFDPLPLPRREGFL